MKPRKSLEELRLDFEHEMSLIKEMCGDKRIYKAWRKNLKTLKAKPEEKQETIANNE